MQVEHHDLEHEFPEFKHSIDALKVSNEAFGKLFTEYESLTQQIEDLEEHDLPVDDFTVENMKKKRVRLKDELYTMLRAN